MHMKHSVLTFTAACFLAFPAVPQEAQEKDGFSLMEEGAKLFFKGIIEEMDPALEGLRGLTEDIQPRLEDFMLEMGPALADLLGKIDDFSAYDPPEILPNGDIIMRRKTPQEPTEEQDGEIDI
ncbi:ATPases of the AAA+ class [hydrothermal vent metagenome]|uniref:ATPases of the AAA+ class n=1 Tax=hydrothermal vent metagenome TaxID=652676 RepID=A0A3B0SMG6_9ZZZZ